MAPGNIKGRREKSPSKISPSEISPDKISPNEISPNEISPNEISPNKISHNEVSPNEISPNEISPTVEKFLKSTLIGLIVVLTARCWRQGVENIALDKVVRLGKVYS